MIPQLQIGRELSKPPRESGAPHKYTDGTRCATEVTAEKTCKEKCFPSSPPADRCAGLPDIATWACLAGAQLSKRTIYK